MTTSRKDAYSLSLWKIPLSVGKWEQVFSMMGGKSSFELEEGRVESKTTEHASSLGLNLGGPLSFLGVPMDLSISYDISNSVTEYLETTSTTKFTVECEYVADAFATSIWQFVVVAPDGSEKIKTKNYMCRYNEIANEAPRCPYPACDIRSDHF